MAPRSPSPSAGMPADMLRRVATFVLWLLALNLGATFLVAVLSGVAGLASNPRHGVATLLRAVPLLVMAGAAGWYARRLQSSRVRDQEQRLEDAERRERWMRDRGDLAEHAAAVAAVPAASRRVSRPPPGAFPASAVQVQARCTWCGTVVPASQGDAETGMAQCPRCTTRFSLRDEMQKAMGMRPEPGDLETHRHRDTLVILHPAHADTGTGLVVAASLCTALTIPHALNTGDWAATGVVALVTAAFMGLNAMLSSRKTRYTVMPERLSVEVEGFLGRRLGEWPAKDVDQVFLRERLRTRKERDSHGHRHKVTTRTYDVILRDVADRETRLARDLPRLDHALYIEQEIENGLGVVDRPEGRGPSR